MEDISYRDSVREAITQALLLLMENESYEDIKVSDIVRKAGVSRSSFYRNFFDKDDVLEKYINWMFSLSMRTSDPYSGANLRNTIIAHYEMYYENRHFLKILSRNNILFRFLGDMSRITEETIADSGMTVNVYQSSFFSAANLGVLAKWLERDCRETPEEIADAFIELLFRPRLEGT